MALSAAHCSQPILRLLQRSQGDLRPVGSSLCFRSISTCFGSIRASAPTAPSISGNITPAISLTEKALNHLNKMRSEKNQNLCLRIGVKQGGCSGMSYMMEFEERANSREDDSIIEYDGFTIVCDPKSLLFMYGMQLDFSDALIGGGFSFKNPNATKTCGCGKSFAAGAATETTASECTN